MNITFALIFMTLARLEFNSLGNRQKWWVYVSPILMSILSIVYIVEAIGDLL